MTEEDYIVRLRAGWPQESDASTEVIAIADEAVRAFPESPRLLVMRGNLIELGCESSPHELDDALGCYRRATEVAPDFAEAWEEIGHFYDAVLDDEEGAKPYFERARSLGGKVEPASGGNR